MIMPEAESTYKIARKPGAVQPDEVSGYVIGHFGIRDDPKNTCWVLDHIPTGTRILRVSTKEEIEKIVEILAELDFDWSSADISHYRNAKLRKRIRRIKRRFNAL